MFLQLLHIGWHNQPMIWRNKLEERSKNMWSSPFLDGFFPFHILLAKWIPPLPYFFFPLNVCLSYSVFHSYGFLGVSFTILSFLLGPTFPTTCMQQPVLPYQERVHSQASSRREQGRLAPIPQWKQVKKLLVIQYPTPPMPGVLLSQSFSSNLFIILNDFEWIKSIFPFSGDACLEI